MNNFLDDEIRKLKNQLTGESASRFYPHERSAVNDSQKKPTVGKFGGQLNVPLTETQPAILLSEGHSPRYKLNQTFDANPNADTLISGGAPLERIREVATSDSIDNFIRAVPVQADHSAKDEPLPEESITAGDSAIINNDIEVIKDLSGRSIHLKDNVYAKLLDRIGSDDPPQTRNLDARPPRQGPNALRNALGSSVSLPNKLNSLRSKSTVGAKLNSPPPSQTTLKAAPITSGQEVGSEQRTKETAKPSVMLAPHEMTMTVGRSTDSQISAFFKQQYFRQKSPVSGKTARGPGGSGRRSASTDAFVRLKIERLEGLFKG